MFSRSIRLSTLVRPNLGPMRSLKSRVTTSTSTSTRGRIGRWAFDENTNATEKAHSTGQLVLAGASIAGVLSIGVYGLSDQAGSISENAKQWHPEVARRVRSTYAHIGGGIAVTATTAVAMYRMGALDFMQRRPILSLGVTLGGTIASIVGTQMATSPAMQSLGFASFSAFEGATLVPLALLGGPVVLRAAVLTGAIVGGLSFVAATAPSEQFLYMGGTLAMGLGVVFGASVAGMFLPAASAAGSLVHSISLYGGTVLFGGFMLYDTQSMVARAQANPEFSPGMEAIKIYLDILNIFIRVAQIMAMSNSRRK